MSYSKNDITPADVEEPLWYQCAINGTYLISLFPSFVSVSYPGNTALVGMLC